jgi:hypothetical protein
MSVEQGTSMTSTTGTQRFLSRAVRVFFAHPILYALPAVLITLFGVYTQVSKPDQYVSVGTLSVSSETFLGSLSDARANQYSFESAAASTSRRFNELMQTEGFSTSVAETAQLGDQLRGGLLDLDTLRRTVYAAPAGDFLMHVVASSENPEVARMLATSAITTFREWVINFEITDSSAAETFFENQLATYKAEVDAANADLTDYLMAHPPPLNPSDERDQAEQIQIQILNDQRDRAQQRLDTALDKREAARQASLESSADIDQRLQIVDAPELPTAPATGLRQLAKTMIMFGVLGLLVTMGAVALRTLLDSSILSSADLDEIGLPVLAVVPRSKGAAVVPRMNGARGRGWAGGDTTAIAPVPGMKAIPPPSGSS